MPGILTRHTLREALAPHQLGQWGGTNPTEMGRLRAGPVHRVLAIRGRLDRPPLLAIKLRDSLGRSTSQPDPTRERGPRMRESAR